MADVVCLDYNWATHINTVLNLLFNGNNVSTNSKEVSGQFKKNKKQA